jgi:hypothetical protein
VTQFEAMLLSAAIEGPLAFAVVAIARWPCRGAFHVALAEMLATAATHPPFWQAMLWLYPRIGYWPTLGIGETVVVLVEAVIVAWITGLSPVRALIVSAVANGVAVAIGLVLFE